MAQYQAIGLARPAFMGDCGNCLVADDTVTITAALTTADVVDALRIAGGTRLTDLSFVAGDLDTGTTLAVNVGWRSANGQPITVTTPTGSSTAASNATAFASATASFQNAQSSGARLDLAFQPITFNDDVFVTLIPTANATGISGTPIVTTIAKGQALGVK